MSLLTNKRKRNDYDIENKRKLIWYHRANQHLSHVDLKKWFDSSFKTDIGASTVGEILRNQAKYISTDCIRSPGTKRLRSGDYPNLEKCIYIWFVDKLNNKISISDSILINQARKFGEQLGISDLEFSYSKGWLEKFKSRFNIRRFTKHGEADKVDLKSVEESFCAIKDEISNYSVNDVFNFDETALFYRLQPNKTLATGIINGDALSKERLTVALCTNASGNYKLKPLVIGRFKRPRCFGKVWDPNDVVHYYYNTKAWMTMELFADWLNKLNRSMKILNRNILLLVDNAGGHNINSDLSLSNIKIVYLPPNTTSKLHLVQNIFI